MAVGSPFNLRLADPFVWQCLEPHNFVAGATLLLFFNQVAIRCSDARRCLRIGRFCGFCAQRLRYPRHGASWPLRSPVRRC